MKQPVLFYYFLLCFLSWFHSPISGFSPSTVARQQRRSSSICLHLAKPKGVYSRPSAAIERGSGFFVPGLEGPKVRLVFSGILGTLIFVNHALSDNSSSSSLVEGLAVLYTGLVLLQGAIQLRQDRLPSTLSELSQTFTKVWKVPIDKEVFRSTVEWMSSVYTSLTPATHVILLSGASTIYEYGISDLDLSGENRARVTELLLSSSTGRLALQPPNDIVKELNVQTILLQSVNEDMSILVASDQLLAAFTKSDLQWLGRLAAYVDSES